jgi:hypothetical protein
MDEAI